MAKEYAIYDSLSFEFGLKDVQYALKCITIESPLKRKIIYDIFEYKYDAPNATQEERIFDIKKLERVSHADCTEEVREKLAQITACGVDIFFDGDCSFYTGKLPYNYEKIDDSITYEQVAPREKLLSVEDFKKIIALPTGFEKLDAIKRLKNILNATVLNQENAVEAVCDTIVKAEHIKDDNKPQGIFFFLGPPATGKTFLATLLSENLPGYEKTLLIDMTQYTHEDSGMGLYGTDRMWGNAKPGKLTSFVRKHPKSIIIFDEFEKAQKNIQHGLLSILSGGYLEDGCGWCEDDVPWGAEDELGTVIKCSEDKIESRIDFSETIVIFTSNLGKEVYNNETLLQSMLDKPIQLEQMMFDVLSRDAETSDDSKKDKDPYITTAMLSRLRQGSMVLFNKLDYKELRIIASLTFEKEREAFEQNYNLKLQYDENALDILLLGFAPALDVRAIKSAIGKRVFDSVTDYYFETGNSFKQIKILLDTQAQKDFKEMFTDIELLAKDLKRKNRSLDFKTKISNTKTILKITISDLNIITVKNAQHFAEGGISIEVPEVSFVDIAGHEFVKERLQEVVCLLKDFKTLKSLGTNLSKGMLLYGPPGTGKTMLAKALAHEADLPFISTTGKDLLEEDRIKKVFAAAREYAPSIIFIDELDSIPSREHVIGSVVNDLLTNIDGFNTHEEPIFIIAATNMKDRIDDALLRSGRIDIHVEVAALDRKAREYFIQKMLDKPMFENNIDILKIIKYTSSLNGSDLQKIERESILFMFRSGVSSVTQEILIEQINTIKYGRKIEDHNLDDVLEETACHEAGHAVVSKILNPLQRIEQVTVMPRNNALGFVSFSENDTYFNQTKEYFENQICVSLAGRASQMRKFAKAGIDSGASSDLKNANRLAYIAISRYGMDDKTFNLNVTIFDKEKEIFNNEIIFERMQVWLKELTIKTEKIVDENWSAIETLASLLVEDEQADEKQLDEILKKLRND